MAGWGAKGFSAAQVPQDLMNVVAIAAGGAHSLALKSDGTVTAWGSNSCGQTNVPTDLANVVAVAAGASCSLALRSDGTVMLWGSITNLLSAPPKTLPSPSSLPWLTNIVAIAAGDSHCLAL
ncbi:MAG TPA: RCC1 domain-containing protein, partial [Candidatus Sulfotelmatobacter sp.]|nr:RCC1 domain-containing protein [Candidatus Sulfotelmatobacter sp.]